MSDQFTALGLPRAITDALSARGIHEAFPIQSLTIPDALAGHDVCGRADTGSGKTLAFGIPLVARVPVAEPRRPTGLVLVPTRELAAQVKQELQWLGKPQGLRVLAVYGGVGFEPQRKALRKGVDVVVACPGRLADLVGRGDLTLGETRGNIAALGSGVFLGLYIMLLRHPRFVGTQAAGLRVSATETKEITEAGKPQTVRKAGSALAPAQDSGLQTQDLSPMATVIYGNFLLAVVTLPSGIASFPTISPPDLAAVTFLGIFQIGISYILFIKGVQAGTRPLDASIIGFIEPLLNPVWVFLIIGERPSNWAVLGGAIIVATVAAHTITRQRRNAEGSRQ